MLNSFDEVQTKLSSDNEAARLPVPLNYDELSLLANVCGNFYPRAIYLTDEDLTLLKDLYEMYKRLTKLIDENFE